MTSLPPPSFLQSCDTAGPDLENWALAPPSQQISLRKRASAILQTRGVQNVQKLRAELAKFNNQLDLRPVWYNEGGEVAERKRKRIDVSEISEKEAGASSLILHYSLTQRRVLILDFATNFFVPFCWIPGCQLEPLPESEGLCCLQHGSEVDKRSDATLNRLEVASLRIPNFAAAFTASLGPRDHQSAEFRSGDSIRELFIGFYRAARPHLPASAFFNIRQGELPDNIVPSLRYFLLRNGIQRLRNARLSYSLFRSRFLLRFDGDESWTPLCGAPGCFRLCFHGTPYCKVDSTKVEDNVYDILLGFSGVANWLNIDPSGYRRMCDGIRDSPYCKMAGIYVSDSGIVMWGQRHQLCANFQAGCKTFFNKKAQNCSKCGCISMYQPTLYIDKGEYAICLNRATVLLEGGRYRIIRHDFIHSSASMIYQIPELVDKQEARSWSCALLLLLRLEADLTGVEIKMRKSGLDFGKNTWRIFRYLLKMSKIELLVEEFFIPAFPSFPGPLFILPANIPDHPEDQIKYHPNSYSKWNVDTGRTYVGLNQNNAHVNRPGRYIPSHVDLQGNKDRTMIHTLGSDPSKLQDMNEAVRISEEALLMESIILLLQSFGSEILLEKIIVANKRLSFAAFPRGRFFENLRMAIFAKFGRTFRFETKDFSPQLLKAPQK